MILRMRLLFLNVIFQQARTDWHLVFIVPFVLIGSYVKIDFRFVLNETTQTKIPCDSRCDTIKIPLLSQVIKRVQILMVFSFSCIHILGKSESPYIYFHIEMHINTTLFYLKNCEAVVISSFSKEYNIKFNLFSIFNLLNNQ